MDWRHYWDCYRPAIIRAARTFGMVFVPYVLAQVAAAQTLSVLATWALWDAAFASSAGAIGSLIVNVYEIRTDASWDRG